MSLRASNRQGGRRAGWVGGGVKTAFLLIGVRIHAVRSSTGFGVRLATVASSNTKLAHWSRFPSPSLAWIAINSANKQASAGEHARVNGTCPSAVSLPGVHNCADHRPLPEPWRTLAAPASVWSPLALVFESRSESTIVAQLWTTVQHPGTEQFPEGAARVSRISIYRLKLPPTG